MLRQATAVVPRPSMPQRISPSRVAAHAANCCQPSAALAPRQCASSRPVASTATAACTRLCASTPIVTICPPHAFHRRVALGRTGFSPVPMTGSYQVTPREPGAGATGHIGSTEPSQTRVSPPRHAPRQCYREAKVMDSYRSLGNGPSRVPSYS
jgi:hypothetical protein